MSETPADYNPRRYDDEIELRDLIRPLWRRRWLILAVFVLSVLVAGVVSFMMAPVYQVHTVIALGSFAIEVGSSTDSKQPGPNRYTLYSSPVAAREVILSEDFMALVVEKLSEESTSNNFDALRNKIRVDIVPDTNMLKLTVDTTDPAMGKAFLEQVAEQFRVQSQAIFDRQEQILLSQIGNVDNALDRVESSIQIASDLLESMEGDASISGDPEFRRLQLLTSIQDFEDQRLVLLDRSLELQKDLDSLEMPKVIRAPHEPASPIKPNKKLNMALAGVLGLMVGVFLAFGLEYVRNNPLNLDDDK